MNGNSLYREQRSRLRILFSKQKILLILLSNLKLSISSETIRTIELFLNTTINKQVPYFKIASIPGNVFPSSISNIAPPPVET